MVEAHLSGNVWNIFAFALSCSGANFTDWGAPTSGANFSLVLVSSLQVMHNSATGKPRYISDGYELEGFALPVGFAVATCLNYPESFQLQVHSTAAFHNAVLRVALKTHGSMKIHDIVQENG